LAPELLIRATRILTESVYPWAGVVTSTITQYLYAGDKSRSERLDPRTTGFQIERRDLRKRLRVLAARKKYQVIPLFDLATEQEKADFLCSGKHWRNWTKQSLREAGDPRRELKITVTYQPSTEEQLMFGCVARRWIVRRRDEHDQKFGENWTEAITDAWYMDSRELSSRFAGFSGELIHQAFCYGICSDECAVVHHSGERPSGLCASSQTKSLRHIQLPSGDVQEHTDMSSVRVLSIAEVSVPSSVFEPPKGFRPMPVYPSRFTMMRLNLDRGLKHLFRVSA
jgi:hypothetical protein